MNAAAWPRVKQVFAEVAELPPGDRARAIDSLVAGDVGLRREVEALLAAHDSQCTSDEPSMSLASAAAAIDHKTGDVIGRYRLVERLGEGGFGAVFVADQTEPFQRRVALKVVKLGMDTAAVIARFEAERQTLALMDHPGIAKVFDAGATPRGRPYFVMELVQGLPITDYCDKSRLTIPQRLDLFVDVCRAVQHAHQKGIIHRDLKPGNVLVSGTDGESAPKVIDFGIAKAIHTHNSDHPAFTQLRQFLGTPEYMSPEQAAGSLDIDTRTDVYSLGVMLYQLLTGSTPVDGTKLRTVAHDEVRRIIREEQPPAPSTRLSTMGAAIEELAISRRADSHRLTATIKGELDWIVMKALEKEPSRRYSSPESLAADVERHLHGEPVSAAPPGALYRLGKVVRRRKGAVAAAGLIALAVVVGLALALWGLREANQARHQAQTEADRYRAVNTFLRDMLSKAGPEPMEGHETTVREVVDVGAAALDGGSLRDQPEVEATARLTIGRTYAYLGKLDQAEHHLRRAVELRETLAGRNDSMYAEGLGALATLERQRGNTDRSVELNKEAVEILSVVDPRHADLPGMLLSLAQSQYRAANVEDATRSFALAIETADRIAGPDSPDAMNARIVASAMAHRPQESIATARRAIEVYSQTYGPRHPLVSAAQLDLGALLHMMRDYDGAGQAYAESHKLRLETLGADHPLTHVSRYNLAWLEESRGNFAAAAEAFLALAEDDKRVFGRRAGNIPMVLNRAAIALQKSGDQVRAEAALASAMECFQPPDARPADGLLALISCNLAEHFLARNDLVKTEELARRALDMDPGLLSPTHWSRGRAHGLLGEVSLRQGRFADAEASLLRGWEILSADSTTGRTGFRAEALRRLVRFYTQWDAAEPGAGHAQRAEPWSRELEAAGTQ